MKDGNQSLLTSKVTCPVCGQIVDVILSHTLRLFLESHEYEGVACNGGRKEYDRQNLFERGK